MKQNPLLYGLIGFLLGGLLVSVAATTFDKPAAMNADMMSQLEGKTGDEFDAAYLETMIEHHEGAVDMAEQADSAAKHVEIKALSQHIIRTQQQEIDRMQQWQQEWGYAPGEHKEDDHSH